MESQPQPQIPIPIPPTPYVASTIIVTRKKVKRISKIERINEMLKKNGYASKIDSTKIDVDIIATKNGDTFRFVIEKRVKIDFDSMETFPYTDVNFLASKKPYTRKGHFWYIIISSSDCMVWMRSEDIFKPDNYRGVKPCHSESYTGPDKFYCISKGNCNFINEKNNKMQLCLHCRFTNGKKTFKVIGLEFHPQPDNSLKVFYEFIEEGVQPPKPQFRDKDYMCKLLEEGKLTYCE